MQNEHEAEDALDVDAAMEMLDGLAVGEEEIEEALLLITAGALKGETEFTGEDVLGILRAKGMEGFIEQARFFGEMVDGPVAVEGDGDIDEWVETLSDD